MRGVYHHSPAQEPVIAESRSKPITKRVTKPVVGILADVQSFNNLPRHVITAHYTQRLAEAGATPIVLPPAIEALDDQLGLCNAIVLVGGDDPSTEPFGQPTHPASKLVDPLRQSYETALIEHLRDQSPDLPVLGVCLGMQMMALLAGGHLNQHLPETHGSHADHWNHDHEILPTQGSPIASGVVHSNHRQAIDDPGSLAVLATAHDGIIEAVGDPSRAFYVGVQWHPERTDNDALGAKLFRDLVGAIRR